MSFNKYDSKVNKFKKCYELIRNKNRFIINTGISASGHEDFSGVITMDDNNSNHGYGYYQHKKSTDGVTRFGFLEVQLAYPEILVHETIYNEDHDQNSDAYRWVIQDYSKKEEIFKNCRELQSAK